MKTIIITAVALVLLSVLPLRAQQTAAYPLSKAFERQFKDVADVQWKKVHATVWLARFENNGEHRIAYFDNDGNMILTGRKIAFASTPTAVQKRINKLVCKYSAQSSVEVQETYEIAKDFGKEYFVNLGGPSLELSLIVSTDGTSSVLRKRHLHDGESLNTGSSPLAAKRN